MKLERRERNLLETEPLLSSMTIIGSVFAYSGLETFPKRDKFIQDFFRKSKENRRYSELLKEFIFSVVDAYPFSRRLDGSLRKLELSKSVSWTSTLGGRASKYWMNQESRDREIKIALEGDPSKKTQKLLKELGKTFKKAVKKFYIEEKKEAEKSIVHFKKIQPGKKKFFTIFASKK